MNLVQILWWLLPALGVFWAVGAYNRLVRLRAAAQQNYAAMHAGMTRQSELLKSALDSDASHVSSGETLAGELMDRVALAWRGLESALAQFNALLEATRSRALDGGAIAALSAARGVLANAWQRVQQEGEDLAGAPVPAPLLARWDDLNREVSASTQQFNDSVAGYNEGIGQFPALLLAWIFGFRAARPVAER